MNKKCENCGKTYQAKRKNSRFCSRACIAKAWKKNNKERWDQYNEQWRSDNSDYWKEYYQDGRGKQVQKRRHEKHPLQRKARTAVSNALRLGKIDKPDRCQKCGRKAKLEAHHWKGYDQMNWLNVQWLCRKDHKMADKL